MKRERLGKKILSLVLAVTLVGSGLSVYSAKDNNNEVYAVTGAPQIEKTEYEGKGKVEVEFYGKVKFYNATNQLININKN